MKQRLLNKNDIVNFEENQERFGEQYTIKPLALVENVGKFSEYKNLKEVNSYMIEFDNYTRFVLDKQSTKEDGILVIQIGKRFYKRQFTGPVLFEWFEKDDFETFVEVIKKYKHIKLQSKIYNWNINKATQIILDHDLIIDGNNATINILGQADTLFNIFINIPLTYCTFNNCKFNYEQITHLVRFYNSTNCKYVDWYTHNYFVDKEAHLLPMTFGKAINKLPVNIQAFKEFGNIEREGERELQPNEFMTIKDLNNNIDDFVLFCYTNMPQTYTGSNTIKNLDVQKAVEDDDLCSQQNFFDHVDEYMFELCKDFVGIQSDVIKTGFFSNGSIYMQYANNNQFLDNEKPEVLFGGEWHTLDEIMQDKKYVLQVVNKDISWRVARKINTFDTMDVDDENNFHRNVRIWVKGPIPNVGDL